MCSDRPAGALQKRAYTNAETFTAKMGIYHFGPEAIRKGS